jgi:hypothetical protein
MTTLARIAIALVISLFFSSCGFDVQIGDFGSGKKGNGNIITDTRAVADEFTEVAAQEGLMVYVTQANDFKIEVEADENIIDLIRTDVKNGRLRIHAEQNIGRATKKIFVSLPDVSELRASSGAHLKTENTIKSDELVVDGSSGAILDVEVVSQELEIEASSGANLKVVGNTDSADVDASSGGNINAKDLQTRTCIADASSGGNVKIQVSKSLMADASSGGSISYAGDPSVEKKKSVSGSVHKYN